MELNAVDVILADFGDVWFTNCTMRYRCLKGGRETGKSYNFIGCEPIFKLLSDSRRNIMMIRQNDKDNANSTYNQIKRAAYSLHVDHLFKFTVSPRMIKLKQTGQTILFAGMNDVENITSTTFEVGFWTDIYFEEASQLDSYEDFRVVDGSLRIPDIPEAEGLFAQITLCFNAWDSEQWTNDIFYKNQLDDNPRILEEERYQFYENPDFNIGQGFGLALHTSSYKTNIYRSREKDASMQILKEKAYDIYLVEGLGCWGNTRDVTYSHWTDELIVPESKINVLKFDAIAIGIDTGLSDGEGKIKYSEDNAPRLGSAMTMQLFGVTGNFEKMVGIDEYFHSNIGLSPAEKKTEPQYMNELVDQIILWRKMYRFYNRVCVYVDCADKGFRDGLELVAKNKGIFRNEVEFIASTKYKILTRTRFENLMMAFGDIIMSSRCKNLIREIRNARKSKEGKPREDFDDHAINAWEYAWASLAPRIKRWKSFKETDSV